MNSLEGLAKEGGSATSLDSLLSWMFSLWLKRGRLVTAQEAASQDAKRLLVRARQPSPSERSDSGGGGRSHTSTFLSLQRVPAAVVGSSQHTVSQEVV